MQQCLLLKRNVNCDRQPLAAARSRMSQIPPCAGTGRLMQLLIAAKARSPHKEIRQQSFSLLGVH